MCLWKYVILWCHVWFVIWFAWFSFKTKQYFILSFYHWFWKSSSFYVKMKIHSLCYAACQCNNTKHVPENSNNFLLRNWSCIIYSSTSSAYNSVTRIFMYTFTEACIMLIICICMLGWELEQTQYKRIFSVILVIVDVYWKLEAIEGKRDDFYECSVSFASFLMHPEGGQ